MYKFDVMFQDEKVATVSMTTGTFPMATLLSC